jgi:hypothetical protein
MDIFEICAKEWPIVTQAPLIVIPGATAVFLLGWGIARLRSSQQIETLRERLTLAQEKASAAQDKAVALAEQIQSNVGQGDLLKSANSTVAAIDQISLATQPSPEETRAMLKQVLRDANIPPLTWEPNSDGGSRAYSLYPAMHFLITKEGEKFILFVDGVRLLYAWSLDVAKIAAERYRQNMLAEMRSKQPKPNKSEG